MFFVDAFEQEAQILSDIPADSNSEDENDDDAEDDKSLIDDSVQAETQESQQPSDDKCMHPCMLLTMV